MFVSVINHVIQDLVFTRSKRPQVENPKVKVVEVDTDSGKKMFETSIEFTSEESDFDENFDEKLI